MVVRGSDVDGDGGDGGDGGDDGDGGGGGGDGGGKLHGLYNKTAIQVHFHYINTSLIVNTRLVCKNVS